VNDIDRWVNLEGPEPDEIRALLDAACGVRHPTPAQAERNTQRLYAALAVDRARWARRQAVKRLLLWGLAAACLVAAVGLGLRVMEPPDLALALRLLPSATRAAPSHLVGVESAAATAVPSVSGTSPAR
jgi:hypothetical protein